jgi:hypothetical protein
MVYVPLTGRSYHIRNKGADMALRHRRVCYLLRLLRARAPREWELGLPFPTLG